jgi:hypothetical protein
MLTNRQIRSIGKAILLYNPLPAMQEFHRNPAKNRWLCGGNRSGKSEGNIGYDLCSFALGVNPHRRTPKNATIWAAANSWPLVGKLLWSEKIKSYLPMCQIQSISWHNKQDEIPSELRLVNGNRIEFKAYEQGRKAFEGRAIDAFYGDEQCKSDSEGIWTEIQAKLMDKNGFSAQSMTPIIPHAWLEERIQALPDTDEVFYADLNDNRKSRGGHIDDREIDLMISQWPWKYSRLESKVISAPLPERSIRHSIVISTSSGLLRYPKAGRGIALLIGALIIHLLFVACQRYRQTMVCIRLILSGSRDTCISCREN